MQMHMQRMTPALDDNETGIFRQEPLDLIFIRLLILDAKRQAIRVHNIAARVGQSRRLLSRPDGKIQRGGNEIAVQPFLTADEERQHDALAHVELGIARDGMLSRRNGGGQDLRDWEIRPHRVIRAFRHRTRRVDQRTLRLFRQHALRVQNAVLEGLAEFRRRRVDLPAEPFREAAENLRQHHAGIAPGAEDRRRRDTAREPADTVVFRRRGRHDRRSHRPQNIRARMSAIRRTELFVERVDILIFQQELAVRARNHALEVAAGDNLPVRAHTFHLLMRKFIIMYIIRDL